MKRPQSFGKINIVVCKNNSNFHTRTAFTAFSALTLLG